VTGRAGFVSLIGRPNAGKSTLLNRLVGEKLSIVSARPQTTRNRITGIKNLPHAQVIFVDTPGLHPAAGKLGHFMLTTARRSVEDVDVVCLVVDAPGGDDPGEIVLDPLRRYAGPVFCVLNKVDRVRPKSRMLPLIETWQRGYAFAEIIPVSATEGTNCDRLLDLIVRRLPEHPPFFPLDATSDQPETFFVGGGPVRRRGPRRGADRARAPRLYLRASDHLRRAGFAEGDPDRQGRRDAEADRHGGAA